MPYVPVPKDLTKVRPSQTLCKPRSWCIIGNAVSTVEHSSAGGVQYQLECVGSVLVPGFLCLNPVLKGLGEYRRGRDVPTAKSIS